MAGDSWDFWNNDTNSGPNYDSGGSFGATRMTGGYFDKGLLVGSSGGPNGGTSLSSFIPNSIAPYDAQSDGGAVHGFVDDLSGAASYVFSSFTEGLGNLAKGFAVNPGAYLGDTGSVVGYDRLGNPIYRIIDPRSGAWTTTSTPAWPGGGTPSAYPERTPPSYQTGGVWGWLTNALGLPGPQPIAQIGAVNTPGSSVNVIPAVGNTGISLPQIALGLGAAFVAFVVIRAVVK